MARISGKEDDSSLRRPSFADGLASAVQAYWLPILATLGIIVVLGIIWLILTTAGGSSSVPAYQWDFGVIGPYLGFLFQGLVLSLEITVITISLGLVLGIMVAMARLSSLRPLRMAVALYVEVMRGTPALVQLVWIYYALPIVTGIQLPAFESVILAFTLNLGAFYGEAFRSGIQAIPREQIETGDVLGLSYLQRMRYVIVPQAFRIVLPVVISIGISLFKDTSLVSTLGVADLMYNGKTVATETYRPLEIFTTVAIIYFVVAFPITIIMRRYEIYLSRHLAQER
jgi:polar amino acid transport system permease protein